MYLILFSPQIPLTDSKGFFFFFKGCKSIRIEKTATKFWKLKSRWPSGTRIRPEKMESQVCRGESKNQPDWPHTVLKGLSLGSTRCLDMGVRVRVGGWKQGRPRWELWEVTRATRHLVLPNLQKSGGLFSGKVKPRALTGVPGPAEGNRVYIYRILEAETPSPVPRTQLPQQGQPETSFSQTGRLLSRESKTIPEAHKCMNLGEGPQQLVYPNYLM